MLNNPGDSGMTPAPNEPRQAWLATLAHAARPALVELAAGAVAGHDFETLRAPEVGLAMLRGRSDGAGDRFNLGEATLTRCVVRLRAAASEASIGVGYCLGRDPERAQCIAQLDALLQQPAYRQAVMHRVVLPLRQQLAQARLQQQQRTATSRVEFYALQPEGAR